jgi:hypothetical protein
MKQVKQNQEIKINQLLSTAYRDAGEKFWREN